MKREQDAPMSLKDALMAGESPENIMKNFRDALEEAEAEIERERQAREAEEQEEEDEDDITLEDARDELAFAVLEYLELLGVLPETEGLDIEPVVDMLKGLEGELKAQAGFLRLMVDLGKLVRNEAIETKEKKNRNKDLSSFKDFDADKIIREFIKNL